MDQIIVIVSNFHSLYYLIIFFFQHTFASLSNILYHFYQNYIIIAKYLSQNFEKTVHIFLNSILYPYFDIYFLVNLKNN